MFFYCNNLGYAHSAILRMGLFNKCYFFISMLISIVSIVSFAIIRRFKQTIKITIIIIAIILIISLLSLLLLYKWLRAIYDEFDQSKKSDKIYNIQQLECIMRKSYNLSGYSESQLINFLKKNINMNFLSKYDTSILSMLTYLILRRIKDVTSSITVAMHLYSDKKNNEITIALKQEKAPVALHYIAKIQEITIKRNEVLLLCIACNFICLIFMSVFVSIYKHSTINAILVSIFSLVCIASVITCFVLLNRVLDAIDTLVKFL